MYDHVTGCNPATHGERAAKTEPGTPVRYRRTYARKTTSNRSRWHPTATHHRRLSDANERSWMSNGREDRRKRRVLERGVKKLLKRAPAKQPEESGEEYAERLKSWVMEHAGERFNAEELWSVAARIFEERGDFNSESLGYVTDHWVTLTRRFGRREGGSIHITNPAIELLAKHGYDEGVVIYKHFSEGGTEGGVRSYWHVGESNEELIGVMYAPEQDAVVIWRWGESEHDPGAAVLAEHDEESFTYPKTVSDGGRQEILERIPEGYRTMIDLAMLAPTLRAIGVMYSEGTDPMVLRDRYEQLNRERGGKHLVVWDAYAGAFELCVHSYDDEERTRVWLRDEFEVAEQPQPLYRAGDLRGL